MPRKIKETIKTEIEKSGAARTVHEISQEIINTVRASVAPVKKERKKRILSDEAKDALRERLVKAREVKASKKLAVPVAAL